MRKTLSVWLRSSMVLTWKKYNRVYFFDLDDYKHNLTVNDQRWADLGVWAPYGINVNDTLTAGIKGDVKVPEVWFSP